MTEEKKEYIIVKDMDGNPIARKEITSRQPLQNAHGLVIDGNITKSYGEFYADQELAQTLPDFNESEE